MTIAMANEVMPHILTRLDHRRQNPPSLSPSPFFKASDQDPFRRVDRLDKALQEDQAKKDAC